jgi:hypothetical protein
MIVGGSRLAQQRQDGAGESEIKHRTRPAETADLQHVGRWTRAQRPEVPAEVRSCSPIAPPADALLWSGREHQKNRAGERRKRLLSLAM